jgi:hypothetical protein
MEQLFRFKKAELGVFNGSAEPISDLVSPNCRIMGLTRGKFSLIDLIYAILKKIGGGNVICTTWSAGIKDANNIKWMVDTNLIRSFTLITDHSYATRQKKYAIAIEDLFGADNIRTSEVHAKFVLISNETHKIVIRTSMNLNANKTCENFEIDESEEIYDFYYGYIKSVFDNTPNGFEERSWVVNKALNKYFDDNQTHGGYRFWSNE